MGLLVGGFVDFVMYGTTNINNLTLTIVDPFILAVIFAVTGGVVGAVLGRRAAPAA